MKFDIHKDGASVTLTLQEKKLDSTIASELKGEFLILAKPKIEHLVIDLHDVEFCDSSGLSALLIADRKMKEHGGIGAPDERESEDHEPAEDLHARPAV